MFSTARANGKFGELLQGALPGEENHFLLSVPINVYSTAQFFFDTTKSAAIYPAHKAKSAYLALKMMDYFRLTCGWELKFESELNEGKGLGSSTADLVASARAIVKATGKTLPMEVFLSFLREIEPSDGIMYSGLVCFYHRKVKLHSQLRFYSNFTIAGVDEGGTIETVSFNRALEPYTMRQAKYYFFLLEKILDAIKKNDLKTIGEISTQSAIAHQERNPKKHLEYFLEICELVKAAGVIIAHSGTYIGIILDKANPLYIEQLSLIKKKVNERSLKLEIFDTLLETTSDLAATYV